jgi:hypothetical protein
VGADDDEFADELGEGGKDVEDQPPAGGGGVELLVQGGEADLAALEVGDHGDEVFHGAAVPVEAGDDEGVAFGEEGMAGLKLGAQRGLAGLLVGEDPAAAGLFEGVDLPFEVLATGRDPGVADADLRPGRGEGAEEIVGELQRVRHGVDSLNKGSSELLNPPGC